MALNVLNGNASLNTKCTKYFSKVGPQELSDLWSVEPLGDKVDRAVEDHEISEDEVDYFYSSPSPLVAEEGCWWWVRLDRASPSLRVYSVPGTLFSPSIMLSPQKKVWILAFLWLDNLESHFITIQCCSLDLVLVLIVFRPNYGNDC